MTTSLEQPAAPPSLGRLAGSPEWGHERGEDPGQPRLRLAIASSHPVPYHVPTYRALANHPGIDLEVLYAHDHGVEATFDVGFGRIVKFDMPLLDGYSHRFLRNLARNPRLTFAGQINHELPLAIARGQYDAVVVHGYNSASTLAAFAGPRSRRTKVLLRGESTLLNRRTFGTRAAKSLLLRALFARVDHFLAIGSCSRDYFRAYGVPAERITLAPYTVDNAWFEQRSADARRDPLAARRRLGLPDTDDTLFLYCSKIVPHKRPLDVLHAFCLAGAPAAHLVYVGEGEQMPELRARIAKERLEARVHVLGFRNQTDLPEVYGACDVFVQASEREPWGMVVNEAMASGMAICASDQVGSAYDLVTDNGAMFPVGDVRRLAELFQLWATSRQEVERMKAASAKRIAQWTPYDTAVGIVRGVRNALRVKS
jgi:glycosyltransferase involved in cell wall biosynthesis